MYLSSNSSCHRVTPKARALGSRLRAGAVVAASLAVTWLATAGCSTQVILIRNTTLDGNNDYWVCEGGTASTCRGEKPEDIDPKGFQYRSQVVAPPKECTFGAANFEVVLEGTTVKRVRYECANEPLNAQPSGLPSSTLPPSTLPPSSVLPAGAGLPPSVPAALTTARPSGLPPSTLPPASE
jgi:hypothetical protein